MNPTCSIRAEASSLLLTGGVAGSMLGTPGVDIDRGEGVQVSVAKDDEA
jgi:hypothetical protein